MPDDFITMKNICIDMEISFAFICYAFIFVFLTGTILEQLSIVKSSFKFGTNLNLK